MFGKKRKSENSSVEDAKKKHAALELYGELTLRNSVKKMYAGPAEGADVVKSSANAVIESFSKTNVERNESFDEACERLGVGEDEIPLIHNQLMLQTYVSFFVGVVALIFIVAAFVAGSMMLVKLVALGAAMASFGNAVQASVQCFRVRSRSLVDFADWCASPDNWVPRKIGANSPIADGDSRRDKKFYVRCVGRARKYYFVGLATLVVSLPGFYLDALMIDRLHYTTTFLGFVFIALAVNNAIVAMQCAKRCELDFISWLSSPEFWFPEAVVLVPAKEATKG